MTYEIFNEIIGNQIEWTKAEQIRLEKLSGTDPQVLKTLQYNAKQINDGYKN